MPTLQSLNLLLDQLHLNQHLLHQKALCCTDEQVCQACFPLPNSDALIAQTVTPAYRIWLQWQREYIYGISAVHSNFQSLLCI